MNEKFSSNQLVFVITQPEIEKMLDMAKQKKDNIFIHVTSTPLGACIRIKQQFPYKINLNDKDWIDITDYESW